MSSYKIAFVKSSIYQDLWVSNITNDFAEIYKTTMMRCPAIALAEQFAADFIIVKESNEFPCQINPNCLIPEHKDNIKYSKEGKNPGLPFLDETYHRNVSIDSVSHNVDEVDWSKYKIVITINACIPSRITTSYPKILWAYYIGENDAYLMNRLIPGYDLILNQDVTLPGLPPFSIGFPYSMVGPTTLEELIQKIGGEENGIISVKKGIFMEINNTQERPVKTIPDSFLQISRASSQPIIVHHQNIVENAKLLKNAKYFVKLHGRQIRGNGVLEVISMGTLILINKQLIIYNDLIPDECHVETPEQVAQKIIILDQNPEEYTRLVQLQRERLRIHYFETPMENLFRAYQRKIQ